MIIFFFFHLLILHYFCGKMWSEYRKKVVSPMQRLRGPIRSICPKILARQKERIVMLKKRLMSALLSLSMVLGLGTSAFAS